MGRPDGRRFERVHIRHVPTIDRRYWAGITFASIFGTNLGDFYAHHSGLGLGFGLIPLLALFAVTYGIEARDRTARELYYWLAIIIIRTGATNIADALAFRVRIPAVPLVAGLAGWIVLFAWLEWVRRRGSLVGAADRPVASTGLAYWGAMLGAGVFGTVLGDICSHHFGQGASSVILGLALVILLATTAGKAASQVALYWCTIALARTAGTCMGDWFAENRILNIGLPLSTLLTGAAFVAILALWRDGKRAGTVIA